MTTDHPPAPPVLAPSTLIDGRYIVQGGLGRGGMADVYRAEDRFLRRQVALKISGIGDRDPFAEGAALAAMRNPHVAAVYAAGIHDGAAYLAMELVEGMDLHRMLQAHLQAGTPMPLRATLRVLAQIAGALTSVHALGVLHRDVKPANIVVEDGTGRAVLVDFGLAERSDQVKASNIAVGTPQYMAPELWEGRKPDASTDLYALGCTAYEVLTGQPPFDTSGTDELSRLHRRVAPPRASVRRPELESLDGVLLRALAKDPAERLESCLALGSAFEDRFAGASPASAPDAPPREPITGVRVLVVDDDRTFGRFAARCAEVALGAGAAVRRAESGVEAITEAGALHPDLVLLDFSMPDMDGVEVLTEMRARGLARHAHVVVLSASADMADLHRFRILGVIDFFEKPVAMPDLVARLVFIAKVRGWLGRPTPGDEAPTLASENG